VTKVPDHVGHLALGTAAPSLVSWTGPNASDDQGSAMTVLELSRWQFGITTVYHFIFVPLTIGLSLVVACMHTAWLVKKDPAYLRMTKFFGKIFVINFAVGVVTGIVQEFQFGMNWSAYCAKELS
jgi:cytochrome bd-type quinol oxidase subunit 1